MLWLKNSALILITILSLGFLLGGIIAAACIRDAFSQDIKAGLGVSAFAFLGLPAAFVFSWACKTWWDLHWLKNYGLETTGFVVLKAMPSGEQALYEFYVTYKFTAREGKEYHGCVTIPGPIGLSWQEGHKVTVLYDPDNPQRNITAERWLKI